MSKKTKYSPSLILHVAEEEIRWAIANEKGDLWQHPFCKSRGIHFYAVDQRLLEKEVSSKDRSLFLLEKLFEEEIKKVDPEFFEKPIPKKWTQKYPTPYHLIVEILLEKKRPDIRLYYLSLWFLMKEAKTSLSSPNDQSFFLEEDEISFSILYKRLQEFLNKNNLFLHPISEEKAEEILMNHKLSLKQKEDAISNLFKGESSCEKDILLLLAGGKISVKNILEKVLPEELEEDFSISFLYWTPQSQELLSRIFKEKYFIIQKIKECFDWIFIRNIMEREGYHSVSAMKKARYSQGNIDIQFLKKIVQYKGGNTTFSKEITDPHSSLCGESILSYIEKGCYELDYESLSALFFEKAPSFKNFFFEENKKEKKKEAFFQRIEKRRGFSKF